MYTQKKILTNKYNEYQASNNKHKENIQTVAKDFSRRREQKPAISRMFVRQNVWSIKRKDKEINDAVVIQTALC